jgi:hypothetical protein
MTDLRVGDADRDRAAAELGEHFALGRLTADEHAERLDAAWTARTRADLDLLFHDLPSRAAVPAARPPGRPGRGWRPVPFLPLLVVLVVLSAVTHFPFWLAAVALGAVLFSRARRASRRTGWSASAGC